MRWKRTIRIRHVASRTYLSIDPSHVRIDVGTGKPTFSLKLLKNPICAIDSSQDTTLFQLIPISAPSISGIPYGSFLRIQHVLTGCWMHSANGEEKDVNSIPPQSSFGYSTSPFSTPQMLAPKSFRDNIPHLSLSQHGDYNHSRFNSFSTLVEDQPEEIKTNDGASVQYRITASQELYYHDCFSITNVEQELSDTFNIANEMLPYLQWYLCQDRNARDDDDVYPIQDVEHESIMNILVNILSLLQKGIDFNTRKNRNR